MSEDTTAPTDEGGSEFEPITSQEALDKVIGQRIDRVKKQFADYRDLKAKASKLDELESANKTELQQLQERYSALESELNDERVTSKRAAFAADKGVPAKALTGQTEEEWQGCVDELLSWRGSPKPKPTTGLKSGASTTEQRMDGQERTAAALRSFWGSKH